MKCMILYHLIQLIAAGGVCSWEIPPKCDSVTLARFPGSACINSSANTPALTGIIFVMGASVSHAVLCVNLLSRQDLSTQDTHTDPQHHSLEPANGPSLLSIILFFFRGRNYKDLFPCIVGNPRRIERAPLVISPIMGPDGPWQSGVELWPSKRGYRNAGKGNMKGE